MYCVWFRGDGVFVVVALETKYDADADLAHQRKVKEKKIEKFNEALKSKKKMKSMCFREGVPQRRGPWEHVEGFHRGGVHGSMWRGSTEEGSMGACGGVPQRRGPWEHVEGFHRGGVHGSIKGRGDSTD